MAKKYIQTRWQCRFFFTQLKNLMLSLIMPLLTRVCSHVVLAVDRIFCVTTSMSAPAFILHRVVNWTVIQLNVILQIIVCRVCHWPRFPESEARHSNSNMKSTLNNLIGVTLGKKS